MAVGLDTSPLEAHAVAYLLQAADLALNHRFVRDRHGVWSDDLHHDISEMEGRYLIGFGDGAGGARADIHLLPAAERVETSVADDGAFRAAWARVSRAAIGYEYPDGMELLSTVHFIIANRTGRVDPDAVADGVARWSEPKR